MKMEMRAVNLILSTYSLVLHRENVPVQLCMRSAGACTDYLQAIESTRTNGKGALLGKYTMTIFKESSIRFTERGEYFLKRTGGTWSSRPFKNWKKAIKTMKAHVKSEVHILSFETHKTASRAVQEDSIILQLQ